MSFESYVRHITQKYRLAVAISVLKEKPPNVTIEKYVEELRNKIIEDQMNDDVTVCSDDFDMDNNTDDLNNTKNNINNAICIVNENFNNDIDNDLNNTNCIVNEDCNNDINNETQDSLTILKDFQFVGISLHNEINDVENVNQVLPNLYNPQIPKPYEISKFNDLTQDLDDINATYCPSQFINDAQDMDALLSDQFRDKTTRILNNNEINTTVNNNTYDSQATILYTLHGFSENYTHVSQSQLDDNIIIPENLIRNITLSVNNKNGSESIISNVEKEKSNEDIQRNLSQINETTYLNINEHDKINNISFKTINQDTIEHFNVNKTQTLDFETQEINKHIENETELATTELFNECINETLIDNKTNEELVSSTQELIPFKVIEELSKVKSYLSRRLERRVSNDGSIDSGYRSDSQSKSSFKSSLQLSVNWLNQSAHCLFNYILQCPVAVTTQQITTEISQVLGQLIDRLHDEERYPSFLDELLENINYLLQDVFEGDNSDENVLLKKDEEIQRIFLLNTSTHIQKYTIEKLTNILENIQSKLNIDMYEINNIDEVENITYIFHILEVILQRYMKSKEIVNISLSNSQNEFPKKSTITNIWRKKWNPHFKEDISIESVAQKKCILIHCNEVLNNFVVGCMDGYSLIAFAALQCFNILQS